MEEIREVRKGNRLFLKWRRRIRGWVESTEKGFYAYQGKPSDPSNFRWGPYETEAEALVTAREVSIPYWVGVV